MPRRRTALLILSPIIAGLLLTALTLARTPARSVKPARANTAPKTPGLVRFSTPLGHEGEGKLIRKTAYECLHDARLKISRWVAYRAEGEDTLDSDRYRGSFYAEPELAPGQRAEPCDYQAIYKNDKTGYDRGHQAPDATVKVFGVDAQRETYSLANITPQHSQLNQGIWQDLEHTIRAWSSSSSPIWVVTGPIFFARQETSFLGSDRVAVPHAYYAILDRGTAPAVVSFLVPNLESFPWRSGLEPFLVSVDSIEKLSGLDFMSSLPDSTEERLECAIPRGLWR